MLFSAGRCAFSAPNHNEKMEGRGGYYIEPRSSAYSYTSNRYMMFQVIFFSPMKGEKKITEGEKKISDLQGSTFKVASKKHVRCSPQVFSTYFTLRKRLNVQPVTHKPKKHEKNHVFSKTRRNIS